MKSYTKPSNPLQQGRCFICQQKIDNPLAYAHQQCCITASIVKELALERAKVESLKLIIEEKDKMLKEKGK